MNTESQEGLGFQHAAFWNSAWGRHLEAYLAAPPRLAYFVRAFFPGGLRVLEIAGGSCRDARFLAECGYDATGTDFDGNTIEYLRSRFPSSKLKLKQADARALGCSDKEYDLSMHNGFWILFDDNNAIIKLLKEQYRVSKRYLLVLVHNQRNVALRRTFREKAKSDKIYDIRFFDPEEIYELLSLSGLAVKSVKLLKFGGSMDILLKTKIRGIANPLCKVAQWVVPRLYQCQSWEMTERVAWLLECSDSRK